MKSDLGTGQWLHACWLEEQKANAHVSRVTEWQNVGLYEGFVMGVVLVGIHYCEYLFSIPDSVTNGQIFAAVGKYLDSHPTEWNKDADRLVVEALRVVWPYKIVRE
jgi:hypothetical protein